jgi:putative protease
VCSFKIEGRLKTPEYVANMCQHYRRAIDAAWEGRAVGFSENDVEEMELSFSRGFSPGWLGGCDHKRLVPATSSAKRGVMLGKVVRVDRTRVWVELQKSVKRGDGVVFEGDRVQRTEQGGRVYEVFVGKQSVVEPVRSGTVGLTFAHGLMDLSRVRPGLKVWKNDDPELNRRLRKSYERGDRGGSIGVSLSVTAVAGEVLRVAGRSDDGRVISYVGTEVLPVARKQVITQEELQRELGRLGNTDFQLKSLQCEISGNPMVPRSMLGSARHAIVEQLESSVVTRESVKLAPLGALQRLRDELRMRDDAAEDAPGDSQPPAQLHVLCRSLEQLHAAMESPTDSIYVDFADIRLYRQAVSQVREAGRSIYLATPRIQKPDEVGVFRAMAKHGAEGFLVRNLGAIAFCNEMGIPWIGDFSLNATNDLSIDWYRAHGAMRVTPSYDLNRDQLAELVRATRPEHLEVVVHQHMPMFHMEHCVFCAVLSPGTNKHNCGRPCDTHQVQLRDRVGMEHPLTADVGCRNTLFNAVPQSAAEAVPGLIRVGVRHFRVELLETTDDPAAVLKLYRQLLEGRTDASSVWRQLKAQNRVGVTRGTLEERRNPLAII